jgi:RND family efflux transporter MFP subunit
MTGIVTVAVLCAAAVGQVGPIEAITRPSEDATLGFVRPGLVARVHVDEGQPVDAGAVIIELDASVERLRYEQLKAEAENTTRLEAAEAELEQARVDLERMRQAHAGGAATDLEVQHSALQVKIKNLTLSLARFQRAQAELEARQAKASLEQMRMTSPIRGIVERVALEEGEAAEQLERIVRVVRIDPLWIEVPAPLALARTRLEVSQPAEVLFSEPDGTVTPVEGKIVFLANVADAASGTLNVRVEVPNESGRPAGEHVRIRFPAFEGEAPAMDTTHVETRPGKDVD